MLKPGEYCSLVQYAMTKGSSAVPELTKKLSGCGRLAHGTLLQRKLLPPVHDTTVFLMMHCSAIGYCKYEHFRTSENLAAGRRPTTWPGERPITSKSQCMLLLASFHFVLKLARCACDRQLSGCLYPMLWLAVRRCVVALDKQTAKSSFLLQLHVAVLSLNFHVAVAVDILLQPTPLAHDVSLRVHVQRRYSGEMFSHDWRRRRRRRVRRR